MSIKVEKRTMDNLIPRTAVCGPALPLAQAGPPTSTPKQRVCPWCTNFLFSVIWYLVAVVSCSFILSHSGYLKTILFLLLRNLSCFGLSYSFSCSYVTFFPFPTSFLSLYHLFLPWFGLSKEGETGTTNMTKTRGPVVLLVFILQTAAHKTNAHPFKILVVLGLDWPEFTSP